MNTKELERTINAARGIEKSNQYIKTSQKIGYHNMIELVVIYCTIIAVICLIAVSQCG